VATSIANVAGVEVDTRHWIDSHRIASLTTFSDISPIDEQPIAEIARGGEPEVAAAVRAAGAAFPSPAAGRRRCRPGSRRRQRGGAV
jgi:aminomuconate-semialdehyde/2-hydroxymuconate-6-semialdehyde dehydrogenase